MSLVSFLPLGIALAQVVIRAWGDPEVANSIGDVKGVIGALQGRTGSDSQIRKIGKVIATELETRIAAEPVSSEREQDLRATSLDVKQLITKLSHDDEAILELSRNPQHARRYLLDQGGNDLIRFAPAHAEGLAQVLLNATADILAAHAPGSPRFGQLALVELLQVAEAFEDVPMETKETLEYVKELHDSLLPQPTATSQFSEQMIRQAVHDRHDTVRGMIDSTRGALIPREHLLERAFDEHRYPLVYLGAGGLGKSVLVGEIADASSKRDRILVACAALDGTHQLRGATQIDDQLGEQVTGLPISLSAALTAFPDRPLLVIDTLDILLREETAAEICALLTRWSEVADLVVTCRSREWYDLVAARQSHFTTQDMPSLTAEEILDWCVRFTEHDGVPEESAHKFHASLAKVVSNGEGLRLLGVPLRLAMATRLYAARGALPPDLTVTQLYKSYWDERVSTGRDGRRNTRAVRAVEETALGIAREIWTKSTERFIEDVRFTGDDDACNALLSEGILHQLRYRFQFFHQTFAEFSVARYLGAEAEGADFERLHDGLRSQRSGYWGIASHLAFEDLSPLRFESVIDSIPTDSVEGVRIILDSLFTRSETDLVKHRLERLIQESPNKVAAASDLLESAPEAHWEVITAGLLSLAATGSGDFTAVVRALALLVRDMPEEDGAATFAGILDIIRARERNSDPLAASESRRLIDAVFADDRPIDAVLLEVAITHYAGQPTPGQYAIIDAACRSGDTQLQSLLITHARSREVPPDSVDILTSLVRAEFDDPKRRSARGWGTWQEVLKSPLPTRWDAVQVRLIAHMAGEDRIRDELLSEALEPRLGIRRDILTNALQFVAVENPDRFSAALCRGPLPREAIATHAYAQLAEQLHPSLELEERQRILDGLHRTAHLNTRRAWPAIALLSSASPEAVDRLLDRLREAIDSAGSSGWNHTVEAVTTVLSKNLSPTELASCIDQLQTLWNLVGQIDPEPVCRILARLAAINTTARDDFDRFIDSNRTRAQLKGISALISARDEWPGNSWNEHLHWIAALIRVRRDGAVIELAQTLRSDVDDPHWTGRETAAVIARIIEAVDQQQEPQVSGHLIKLLAAIAHDGSEDACPTPEQIELVLEKLRFQLSEHAVAANSSRAQPLYSQYVSLITNVSMQVLDLDRIVDTVEAFILDVDTAAFGSRTRKTLELALSSVQRRRPNWWGRLEHLWPRMPARNRGAVADLVLSGLVPEREVIAERLARRADCPPDVAADIHRRLRGSSR